MNVARVIPCLDVDRGRVVKGTNFINLRDAGDPVELAARYDAEGADELVFLDITASSDQRETTVEMAARVAEEVFIPFTIGGGIRSVANARALLRVGADKVAVNTAAVDRIELVSEIAAEFGNQCVVVAIDSRSNAAMESGFEVYVHGGRTPTGIDTVRWAQQVVAAGAGEILLTSMDRDGTRDGFDCVVTSAVSEAVGVPVFSERTANQVRKMLQMAAGPGGTGQKAQTVGYSVGGKSGTARKQVGKSYAAGKYRAWFTGLAPVDKPRIIVAVMVDEPSAGQVYGGLVAAPVFSEVVQQTLRMMNVQPDMAVKPQIVANPVEESL